jgi:hypothetical protein
VTAPSLAWCPDENLIAHARLGGISIKGLEGPDRAWVVAGLQVSGLTADDTARALGCSLRLVRSIRAEPMTKLAVYTMTLLDRLDGVMAASMLYEHDRECEVAALYRELTRLSRQRDKLIGDLARARQRVAQRAQRAATTPQTRTLAR